MQIHTHTYTYKYIAQKLLFVQLVCVCMCMYIYVVYACACILHLFVLYLYVWPKFSVEKPPSHQKHPGAAGQTRMDSVHPWACVHIILQVFWDPAPDRFWRSCTQNTCWGGVKTHLCHSENTLCGWMRYIGPAQSPFQGDLGRRCHPTRSDAAAALCQKPLSTLILQCMYVSVLHVCCMYCMHVYVFVCICMYMYEFVCICMDCVYMYALYV